ncbi:MAG: S-methyl-5-thioribose-1-phosphate isomerase [Chitinivibrionia bacterium]|nr:S-methyl-5-thioribose-1-phosphate isomerase [Chitinivibrionia bacterium]
MMIPTIAIKRGAIEIIDQRALPGEYRIVAMRSVAELCDAITTLAIRGAPALGVAAAFGLLLAVEERWGADGEYFFDEDGERAASFAGRAGMDEIRAVLDGARDSIAATRPTAVNLFWALGRMAACYQARYESAEDLLRALHREAVSIHREDRAMSRRLGENGASLLKDRDSVLTHCNAGGLATSGFGTALGVVYAAVESGKRICVYAGETRPLLQGARLTAWECIQRKIPVTVITDGMAAHVMSNGLVSCVIVGADRIAANGDTANKIGTLNLAIIAKRYGVPFYVAAPSSTIDFSIRSGAGIAIEERSADEVKRFAGMPVAPEQAQAMNPAFDVTPAELISAIITEHGVHYPPFNGVWSASAGGSA